MVATAKKDFPNFCTLPKIRKVFSAAIFRCLLYATPALPILRADIFAFTCGTIIESYDLIRAPLLVSGVLL